MNQCKVPALAESNSQVPAFDDAFAEDSCSLASTLENGNGATLPTSQRHERRPLRTPLAEIQSLSVAAIRTGEQPLQPIDHFAAGPRTPEHSLECSTRSNS